MENEKNTSLLPSASQRVSDEMRLQGANYYNPVVWGGMVKLAKTLIDARACPDNLNTEAKVLVALEAGREIGVSPINALNSFYIVNGKISIYGDMAIALVLRDGHQVDWGKCDANTATVKITRGDNDKSMETTFTFKDAENKGLTKYSDGRTNVFWTKYPENMLKFKAFGSIARFIVADSLRGMKIKEELEGSSFDGEIVEEDKTAPKLVEEKIKELGAKAEKEEKEEKKAIDKAEKDESASLQEFVNKEPEKTEEPAKKRTKAELVKDINKLCVDGGKDPKKILQHYKKKTWLDFTVKGLEKVEESVKLSIKDLPSKKEDEKVEEKLAEEEELPTYFMPDEDTLDVLNELLAKDASELTKEEQNLVDDVSEDRFLGKDSARYKGLLK